MENVLLTLLGQSEKNQEKIACHGQKISVKKVLLGFSKTKRNSFAELRKLATTFDETKHLVAKGEEHRENYTGGHGFFLGGERGSVVGLFKNQAT